MKEHHHPVSNFDFPKMIHSNSALLQLEDLVLSNKLAATYVAELGEQGAFDRALSLYQWMNYKRGRYAPNEFTLVSLFGAARDKRHSVTVSKVRRKAVVQADPSLKAPPLRFNQNFVLCEKDVTVF